MSRHLLLFLLGQATLLVGAAMLAPFFYSLARMTAEVPAFLASLLIVMTAGEILSRLGVATRLVWSCWMRRRSSSFFGRWGR